MSDPAEVTESSGVDRRVERTRAALRSAFNHLILTRGYDDLTAADIAEQANVGRSTFYEHHQNKEDLLGQSMEPLLRPFAEASVSDDGSPRIPLVIEHLWENRKLATALLSGRARGIVAKALAALIEKRLDAVFGDGLSLPPSLAAVQIAHAQLGLIEAWLTGRHRCLANDVATTLQASSRALVRALVHTSPSS